MCACKFKTNLLPERKKFRFIGGLVNGTPAMVMYRFPGAKKMRMTPGMYNIVLRSAEGKPFRALVAMKFEFPLIGQAGSVDPYGFVKSSPNGVAVVATWLGNGSCDFVFVINKKDGSTTHVVASCDATDQDLRPNVTYPPHWFQRLGFWA
jgi:hypothetical protein